LAVIYEKREKKTLRVVAKPGFGFGCGALTYCTVRIKIRKKMASYDYDTIWGEMKRQQLREKGDHAPFVTQPIVVEPMLLSGK
jgi:hypothetical protein